MRRILLAVLGAVFALCLTSTPVAADGQPIPQSSDERQESSDSDSSEESCNDDPDEEDDDLGFVVFIIFIWVCVFFVVIMGLAL